MFISSTACLTDYDMDGWSSTELLVGDACYSIDMYDSYGDGWNSASITVWEDGAEVDSFTLDYFDGSEGSDTYCGTDSSSIEFTFNSGSYDYEIDFEITDPDGATIAAGSGSDYANGDSIYAGTVFEGAPVEGADCDDWDSSINPDATEICDGLDNNCDGTEDEGLLVEMYPDADLDGYGSEIAELVCEGEMGYVDNGDDCDDSFSAINPGNTDIWGDGIGLKL